ncbi:restriction endonuclease [Roseomonas nepalensis]|uniref:Restriction endonuclease n=1 Tax=Muricoccus nepalensis TaxID=1854500 RepID=A0A502G978_9PROT|nr:restriction endonuclease [Roseomonas nepalensis]TPG58181.1 restriction endonuclease [Roseomonas nepalensis]
MTKAVALPKYDDLFKTTLEVLIKLGGSGSIEELDEALIAAIGASQEQLDVTYPKSGAPVLTDRMSWARSFLKLAGFVENPKRGVWVLTEEGRTAASKSNSELKQIISAANKAAIAAKKDAQTSSGGQGGQDAGEGAEGWSDQLLQRVQTIDPTAFERLCQRLLRESGFTRVEVSGKSGDGGIDGVGVLRVNLISFQVLFQCKRWKGSVGSEVVRNFRGAMQGRADKGLVITTGTFTSEARKEATRDGAPAIDLIDGEALCTLMKDLGLGVQVREVRVEEVSIDTEFFASI